MRAGLNPDPSSWKLSLREITTLCEGQTVGEIWKDAAKVEHNRTDGRRRVLCVRAQSGTENERQCA